MYIKNNEKGEARQQNLMQTGTMNSCFLLHKLITYAHRHCVEKNTSPCKYPSDDQDVFETITSKVQKAQVPKKN